MKLKGHTKLEINNKVVFEKDNDITEWVNKALHEGDYGGLIPETWKMPLSQWFSGCILTRGTNTNTLATMCLDSGFNITAQASDGDYSGTNKKRGRKANSTGPVANGYQFVWEWLGDEGNGDIGSICLTRANNGGLRFGDTYTEIANDTDVKSVVETATGYTPDTYTTDADLRNIANAPQLIDYDNEIGYVITLADRYSTTVSIKGYKLNTKLLHLDGVNGCPISTTPEIDETVTLDEAVRNPNISYSFTGDELHFFITNETSTITDYVVDMSDFTVTKEVHNFSGDNLAFHTSSTDLVIVKDAIPVKINKTAGTFFAWVVAMDNKLYKLDMVNDIAIKSYVNPLAGLPNYSVVLGASLTLPNGDFIWNNGGGYCVYYNYVADSMKAVPYDFVFYSWSINGNNYGTVLSHTDRYGKTIGTCFPYVSTVNNLQSLATKNYGDQMRLSYTITEVYPEEEEENT